MALTRRDSLHQVLDGIDAALAAGFDPVKVNVVLMRGVNDDEVVDFATFGRERGVEVRFIEFMPLDADANWGHDKVVPGRRDRRRDRRRVPAGRRAPGPRPRRASRLPRRPRPRRGHPDASPRPFCGSCDRVRLTAEGEFRNCLFALEETDLRALLRGGAGDDELAAAVQASVAAKWAGHQISQVNFIRPARSMSQIGG